jgi:hypothetical protein
MLISTPILVWLDSTKTKFCVSEQDVAAAGTAPFCCVRD